MVKISEKLPKIWSKYTISFLAFLFVTGILLFIPTINLIKKQILDAVALKYVQQSAEVLTEAQSVYTSEVVDRLETLDSMNITHDYHTQQGAIPLPFTYLKAISRRLIEEENDLQIRIYSDYPFPWREEDDRIQDQFEQDALNYFKQNPQGNYYRYQEQNNQRVLRYTIPSVLQPSCIDCHNKYPGTPKTDWQVGDIRGVLEFKQLIRDYDLPVYDTLKRILLLLSIISITGGIGLLISLRRSQQYSRLLQENLIIRQQAMDEAFTSIHNGPLQTLALILRQVQQPPLNGNLLFEQLRGLNREIRAIGKYLTEESSNNVQLLNPDNAQVDTKNTIMLGQGAKLDLTRPLHELFYDTYSLTLERDFPHFAGIKVKICDFEPLFVAETDIKAKLCRWLEEALCNVGKHAQGAKRLTAVGKKEQQNYILRVEDNGCGLTSPQENQGSKNSQQLAQQLKGNFRRENLPRKGTICELSWQLENHD